MGTADSLILIASAKRDEQLSIEHALMSTGRRVRLVRNPVEAERVCANHGGASILVIDSDLLEAPGDPQWRDLRARPRGRRALPDCARRASANRPQHAPRAPEQRRRHLRRPRRARQLPARSDAGALDEARDRERNPTRRARPGPDRKTMDG